MVYDGYQGGFVPVDAASFDVTLEPEAVVLLPRSVLDEQRAAAEALQRRDQARAARHAGRAAMPAITTSGPSRARAMVSWRYAAAAAEVWSSPPWTARR